MVKKIWNKSIRKILAVTLSVSMIVPTNVMYAADKNGGGGYETRIENGKIELTDADIENLYQKVNFQRQSVHDPSITVAEDGTYYVFGSHMGVAKTVDLQNWSDTPISNENENNAYYGVRNTRASDRLVALFDFNDGGADFTMNGSTAITANPDDVNDKVLCIETGSGGKNSNYAIMEADYFSNIDFSNGVTVSMNVRPTKNSSDWNYLFSIGCKSSPATNSILYIDGTIGFIQRAGDPYTAYYPGDGWVNGNTVNNEYDYFTKEANCNKWYKLTYVYSKTSVSIYVNDILAVTHASEASLGETVLPNLHNGTELVLGAGAERGDLENFGGYIDDVRIYNTALTGDEIADIPKKDATEKNIDTNNKILNEKVTPVSYKEAFRSGGYGIKEIETKNGKIKVDFSKFPASDWNTAITANPSAGKAPWSIQGNMWAPDIIYNPVMKKWCMYLSLNGNAWNTVVVLLTSDAIEGPYVYEAPIIYSGFTSGGVTSYNKTDLSLAINNGKPLSSLPARYNNLITGVDSNGTATSDGHGSYGTYWPHAIDPSVFYDDQGELWMNYGSWSGGIYMIKLDKNTGLRDYTVDYPYEINGAAANESTRDGNVTSDPYFGKKVAGGFYLSGEGPYIEKIGNYYYLFISYGFYSPTGGYNMRIFRSENPDGSYVDVNGDSAIYDRGGNNFKSRPSRGLQLMGNYQWDTMAVAEVAQGHNSAFVDKDGNAYVIYHTKFADGTAGHQLRVHQLYQNEDGWIVAAPYEYAGETINDENIKKEAIPAEQIVGNYRLIVHQYLNPKAADNGTVEANLDIVKPVNITLNADGTISGAYTGNWVEKEGTAYATITINNTEYKGVFTEQTIDGSNVKTLCFSAVNVSGECIWGSKTIPDDVAVAKNVIDFKSSLADSTYTDLDLSVKTTDGVTVTWTSSNTNVITNDGKVTPTNTDVEVIMTARISKGDYYYNKQYPITVKAGGIANADCETGLEAFYDFEDNLVNKLNTSQTGTMLKQSNGTMPQYEYNKERNSKVLQQYFGFDGAQSISYTKFPNPLKGRSLEGATVSLWVNRLDSDAWDAVWSFLDTDSSDGIDGRLFFTPNAYLGFNGTGGWFDCNKPDIITNAIEVQEWNLVTVTVDKNSFGIYINGHLVYTQNKYAALGSSSDIAALCSNVVNLLSSADDFYLGYGSFWGSAPLLMDNLKIYSRALSQADIAKLYKEETVIQVGSMNGDVPGELAWWDYSNFFGLKATEDFTIKWKFTNYNSLSTDNYKNYAVAITTNLDRTNEQAEDWYLRADSWSNAYFGSSDAAPFRNQVSYSSDWNWDNFVSMLNGAKIDATLSRSGTTMTFTAVINGSDGNTYHYTVTAKDAPLDDVMVYLGGQDCYLEISEYSVASQHRYDSVTTPPTCVSEGYTTYTCIYCSDSYMADKTEAAGHDYTATYADNVITVSCSKGDSTKTVTLNAEGGAIASSYHVQLDNTGNIVLPDNTEMSKTGYAFEGWKDTEENIYQTEFPVSSLPSDAENIALTAVWKDTQAPTGTITVSDSKWQSLLETVTFEIYKTSQEIITIEAEDNEGNVDISYLIATEGQSYSLEDLKNLEDAEWNIYQSSSKPKLAKDTKNVIYAKLTDASGNITYISSNGIVEDETSPQITEFKIVSGTLKDTSVSVQIESNEAGTYYFILNRDADDALKTVVAENLSSAVITSVGQGTEIAANTKGTIDSTGLDAGTLYNAYLVIKDKAGNISECSRLEILTAQEMIDITNVQITGTANYTSQLSVSAQNDKNEPMVYQWYRSSETITENTDIDSLEEISCTSDSYTLQKEDIGKYIAVYISIDSAQYSGYTLAYMSSTVQPKNIAVAAVQVLNKNYDGTANAEISEITLNGIETGDSVTASAGTAVFADKNAGTNKKVTVSGITLNGTDAAAYKLTSTTAEAQAAINKKTVSVKTVVVKDKVYDGTTAADIVSVEFEGAVEGEEITYEASMEFVDANAGPDKEATGTIALTNDSLTNYELSTSTISATAEIKKAKPQVTVPDNITAGYNTTLGEITLPTGFEFDISVLEDGLLTKVGDVGTQEFPAIYTPEDSNYESITIVISIEVTKASIGAPVLSKTDETIDGKQDGKINGLETDMEFSTDNITYTAVTDPDMSFAPGTYYVRYMENKNHFVSQPTELVIEAGRKLKITFMADDIVVKETETGWNGTITDIPEIPAKQGYDQIAPKWDVEDFTNIQADMTVHAIYTINKYTVILTQGEGYTLQTTDSGETTGIIEYLGNCNFKLVLAEGYSKTENFAVKADGILLTPTADGSYSLTDITKNQTVTVEGIADITPATGEIRVADDIWNTRLEITAIFNLFFKDTQTVTITAEDKGSGVDKIFYYLSKEPVTEDIVNWTEYNNAFQIVPNNEYVIYAKITDKAGNCTFINSEGMILDNIAPVIMVQTTEGFSAVSDGAEYQKTQTFKVQDNYLKQVTVNNELVSLSEEGTFVLKPSDDKYTVEAEDKAGNKTVYTISVKREAGTGSVAIEGWTYGEEANQPIIEDTNQAGYTVKYYKGSEELKEIPKNAGKYSVKVIFHQTDEIEEYTASADFVIAKAVSPDMPSLEKINESIAGKADGRIEGLTLQMEYSTDGVIYTDVMDEEMYFAAGTYFVRLKESENYLSSEAAKVVIDAGRKLLVTFVADNAVVSVKEVLWNGEITDIPEIPEKKGYDRTAPKWNVAEFKNIQTDMTIEAIYTINQYIITLTQKDGYILKRTDSEGTGDKVNYLESCSFGLTVAEGYRKTKEFAVKANGVVLTADANGIYSLSDISEDYIVTVEGIEKMSGIPQIKGENGKFGWEVIADEIRKVLEQSLTQQKVDVQMNGSTELPKEIILEIKGEDISLELDMGAGILWTIDGKTVTGQNFRNISMEVILDTDNIPQNILTRVTSGKTFKNLTLVHEGEFGFQPVLTIYVGKENAGLMAKLYYYNKTTGQMEISDSGKIDVNGNTKFTFTHASDYTIVIDAAGNNQEESTANNGKLPVTGDSSQDIWNRTWLVMLASMLMTAGIGSFSVKRRKK